MRVSLFSWDANPAVDKAYRINIIHAENHVSTGRALRLADGIYQMRATPSQVSQLLDRQPRGRYDTAWGIKVSGYIPVWQMRSQRTVVAY